MTPVCMLVVFLALFIQMAIAGAPGTANVETDPYSPSSTGSSISDDDDDHHDAIENKKLAPFLVRLHLIRHGETHANVQNIVLGQGDSPLTDAGVAVACSATAYMTRLHFWRTYCSDLYRAHRTARIVLGLEDADGNVDPGGKTASDGIDLIVDSHLRELAKGAREGYLKKLSYEEAVALRRNEAGYTSNSNAAMMTMETPKLESIDDAWNRVKHWIDCIVEDASDDYYSTIELKDEQDNEDTRDSGSDPKIYDVFALSHSALIRTMIHKMVDSELPSNYATTKEGSLSIPNLSRTIIDVRPYYDNDSSHPSKKKDNIGPRWTPSLFRLTDVSHLSKALPKGPPYL